MGFQTHRVSHFTVQVKWFPTTIRENTLGIFPDIGKTYYPAQILMYHTDSNVIKTYKPITATESAEIPISLYEHPRKRRERLYCLVCVEQSVFYCCMLHYVDAVLFTTVYNLHIFLHRFVAVCSSLSNVDRSG